MKKENTFFIPFIIAISLSFLIFPGETFAKGKTNEEKGADIPKLLVPRTQTAENFPCSKCHGFRASDKTKRQLKEYHSAIELKHAKEQRWCYDCHEGDKLRLQNGRLIDFDKSYILCGQCHGTIFRDWKAGVHGKRTGSWNEDKLYRLCVYCHDPHQPKYRPLKPKHLPVKPVDIN